MNPTWYLNQSSISGDSKFTSVLGLCGTVFVAGGCVGMTSEKGPGTALCWTQPAPADPLLTKAESTSDTGGASVLEKRSKTTLQQLRAERGVWENKPKHPGQKEMKGQDVLQAPEHGFPVAYGDSHGKAGFPPAAHGEAVSEQIPTLQPVEYTTLSRWIYPEGRCSLSKSHAGAGKKCEEEGVAEMWCCELEWQHHYFCTAEGGEEVKKLTMKLSLGRKRERKGKVVFVLSLLFIILICF